MATTILSENPILNRFNWGAVLAGAVVAAATSFFLLLLGAGFGLMLVPATGAAVFFGLGAIYVLAAQAFGFAAGGHVTGRIIGPAIETSREEEYRAGAHGLVMWALSVAIGLALTALVAAGGSLMHSSSARSESGITAYWSDILLRPAADHAMARGEDLAQDKLEAARVLAADLHPNAPAAEANRADLVRLAVLDAGLSRADAADRVDMVQTRMRQELENARKAAAYAALWTAFALLFGAVVSVAAAISARWEDDKIHFNFSRRYY